jgi:Transposase DDE domain group 1
MILVRDAGFWMRESACPAWDSGCCRHPQDPGREGTFKVKRSGRRKRVGLRGTGEGLVSRAGAELLYRAARASGLDDALSRELAAFRKARTEHDPGKVVLDLAVTLAAGGDCPADAAILRGRQEVFGPVASDPTISRLVHALAAGPEGLPALRRAAGLARARAGAQLAAAAASENGREPVAVAADVAAEVVVDIDGTLITAHSEKEDARPTYKRGYGFHPLLAYLDHGTGGTGEPVAGVLRPGNAGSGTAADHIAVLDLIEAQLTEAERPVLLVRTDTAACNHEFLALLKDRGHGYSVGFAARADVAAAIGQLPPDAWVACIDADDGPDGQGPQARDGAWVAEITHLLALKQWPAGMRVIARKERPHPGAQLRLTDVDGHRITCFATDSSSTDLPALDLRHRRRARCEDRIRAAKDTGARNLPYKDFAANAVWLQIVLLAQLLTALLQRLALHGEHAVAEPKRLRLRLFAPAGRLVRTGRRRILDLDKGWPWTPAVLAAGKRLDALAA